MEHKIETQSRHDSGDGLELAGEDAARLAGVIRKSGCSASVLWGAHAEGERDDIN